MVSRYITSHRRPSRWASRSFAKHRSKSYDRLLQLDFLAEMLSWCANLALLPLVAVVTHMILTVNIALLGPAVALALIAGTFYGLQILAETMSTAKASDLRVFNRNVIMIR